MVTSTQHSGSNLDNTDHLLSNIHVSDSTVLYTGTVPFIWSCDIYLQELLNDGKWYITIHLTAQGSKTGVFKSQTVEIEPGVICAVPFPVEQSGNSGLDGYYVADCEVSGISEPGKNMYVRMTAPLLVGQAPSFEIIDTEVQTDWIIGAREIVLTDPPIMQDDHKKMMEEVVVIA